MNNLEEYYAYTIPTDQSSSLRLSIEVYPVGTNIEAHAEFDSLASRTYALEETTNLIHGAGWSNVTGYVRGTDEMMELETTNSAPSGMYRLKVDLP
jgi:uncharacterized protein YgiM (DUF1202 family)